MQDSIKNVKVRVAFLKSFHVLFKAIGNELKILSAVPRIFLLADLNNVLIKALAFVGCGADSVAGGYTEKMLVVAAVNFAVITLLFRIVTLGGFLEKLIVCFAYRLTHESDIIGSAEHVNIVRYELPVVVSQRTFSLTE